MARDDVERILPTLKGRDLSLSPEDFNVNCLAFAVGDNTQWWEPPSGHGTYWPQGFREDLSVQTVEEILKLHGFTVESDRAETPDTDAIAIYGERGEWTHFAKFANGKWSSKLGELDDVEDIMLDDLEVPDYGKCLKILKRPKA